jgi:transposase
MTKRGTVNFKKVGAELKTARVNHGVTAREVALHFSKSIRTIYRWEDTGKGLTPFYVAEYSAFLKKIK